MPTTTPFSDSERAVIRFLRLRSPRRWPFLVIAFLAALTAGCATSGTRESRADTTAVTEPVPIDLTAFYDLRAHDSSQFGAWEVVPKGRQHFDGTPFEIGGMIRLYGTRPPPHGTRYRDEVTGIPIGRKFEALHLLHGTGWTTNDGTLVARVIFHYADGDRVSFPIVYGEHVRDWWRRSSSEANLVNDPRSSLVWEGSNRGTGLRFYRTTLLNPHAARIVDRIDVVSAQSLVTPAIVAMTLDRTGPATNLEAPGENAAARP